MSALSLAETVLLDSETDVDAERRIKEFFGRGYVILANVDQAVCEVARRLVRTYGLKPLDAVHMATAIFYQVPVLETFDGDLLKLNGLERLRDMPSAEPLEIIHPRALPPLPLFPNGAG